MVHLSTATAESPWPELLGYALAFIGGLAVAAMGIWGSFLLATTEWKRTETRRLAESRREVYAIYARELKGETRVCRQIAAGLGVAKSRAPLSRDEGRSLLAESSPRRSAALEDILLVGSPGVAESARLWKFAQQQLENRVLDQPVIPEIEYIRLYSMLGHARDQYYDRARADLAVGEKIRLRTRQDRLVAYNALDKA
jgi:hypothetical protein